LSPPPAILSENRKRNSRSLHCTTPDFLFRLVALAGFMRLSLLKPHTWLLVSASWQEIRVRSGRDDNFLGPLTAIRLTAFGTIPL
jgi:hypothetical protein